MAVPPSSEITTDARLVYNIGRYIIKKETLPPGPVGTAILGTAGFSFHLIHSIIDVNLFVVSIAESLKLFLSSHMSG